MSRSNMKPCMLVMVLASAGLITACGGGGGGVETGNGGVATTTNSTATTVSGTISGLGSVIVNGIRYETIGAAVRDMDDNRVISRPLGLGMTVKLEPSTTRAAAAGMIHVLSGIKGGISATNSAAKTLNVAGLPVTTDATTFIVTAAGTVGRFTDLTNGQAEVYGLPQSDGTFKATRIELQLTAPRVQLVGVVSNLNTTNTTFTLGGGSNTVTVSYAAAMAPTGLVNGSVVAVLTGTTATAVNYTASSVYLRSPDNATSTQHVTNYRGTSGIGNEVNELYGMVSGLTPYGTGCTLQVQGVPTSLTSAALCASIKNGDYIEVKGLLADGTLAAYRVEFRTAGGDRDLSGSGYSDDLNDRDGDDLKYSRQVTPTSSSSSSSAREESFSSYELYGMLSNCSANTCTLTSNGIAVAADLSTAYWEHGYSVTSGWVEAKGYMTATNTFKVTKIEPKR